MSLNRPTKWTAAIAAVVIAAGAGYAALDTDGSEASGEADRPAVSTETTLVDEDVVADAVGTSSTEGPTGAESGDAPSSDGPADDPSGPGDPGPAAPGSDDPGDPSDPSDPSDPGDPGDPIDPCLLQLCNAPVNDLEVLDAGPPSDPTPPDPSPGGGDDLECERPGKGEGGVGGVDHHGDGRRIACS